MKQFLAIGIISAATIAAPVKAATLVTTGETIDATGATLSIIPTSFGGLNLITHNGGGSFTIDETPPNNDFYIAYANSNVDPDLYNYLQIDFAAGMTVTSPVSFQLYLANGNTFAGGDLSANATMSPSPGAFSVLFDLAGTTSRMAVRVARILMESASIRSTDLPMREKVSLSQESLSATP